MIFRSASLPRIDLDNLQGHLSHEPIIAASTDPVRQSIISPAKRERTRPCSSVQLQICHLNLQANAAGPDIQGTSHPAKDDESLISFLPSTVPETMDEMITTADIEVETEDREARAQDTQFSNATQPISQTAYDDVIRSRSEQLSLPPDIEPLQAEVNEEELGEQEEGDEDMQDSIQEGDSNFLDICSSFAVAPNDADSVPLNFSPTQTQHEYTQFRESQRFKTPATAGRKRDHAGNFADTPVESRNPFARNGGVTPGKVVGLSQAFENTQAASSPFPIVPTSELRSDKPSPGIAVERHVIGLLVSSPLHLLSDPWRPSEPASQYVPAGHSQALRRALTSEIEGNEGTQESTTDEFDSIQSVIQRQKRAKEREARARKELEAVSSPASPLKHNPLKIGKLPRRAESERPVRARSKSGSESLPSSPPALDTEETAEDIADTAADEGLFIEPRFRYNAGGTSPNRLSSAAGRGKKSVTTLVPDTTKMATRSTVQPRHNVQPSPSENRTRYGRSVVHVEPVSSNSVRVANSQRSILSTQDVRVKPVASSAESVDVIPASPEGHLLSTEPSALQQQLFTKNLQDEPTTEGQGDEGNHNHNSTALDRLRSGGPRNSSIPETSSSVLAQHNQKESTYVTAPTNQPAVASTALTDWSSQPVRGTPPGRKRKRMDEISQEPVFPTASQSSAFDPTEVLALDQDPEMARVLSSSQDPDPVRLRKRSRLDPPVHLQPFEIQESVPNGSVNSANIGRQIRSRNAVADDVEHMGNAVPSSSLSELPETPSLLKTPSGKVPSLKSIYSLGDSPQPRTAPLDRAQTQPVRFSLQEVAAGRNRRVVSKTTLRTPRATVLALPPIVETSPDPIAIGTTSTVSSTPVPMASEIVAPQMVFAYFMEGNTKKYHPAISQGYSDETQEYTIEWPGYAPEQMQKHKICSLDLRIGDEVRVGDEKWPKIICRIHGFKLVAQDEEKQGTLRDIYGHTHVLLEPKDPKVSMPQGVGRNDQVPIEKINLMANQFTRIKKRPFVCPTTAVPPPSILIPRPSTPQAQTPVPSTPSSRSRRSDKDMSVQPPMKQGIFSSMVFALSIDSEDDRRAIGDLVLEQGGVILSTTFQELVTEDIHVKPNFKNFAFAALLADRHSRKPKYLQALALGLPCLSGRWVEASVKRQKIVNWQDYLLPAGESEELDGAVRSRILPAMDASIRVSEVVDQRPRFFTDANIVFVKGRGKAEEKREPYLFFVRVMDAAKVEQVTDLAGAKLCLEKLEQKGKTWVVVDDKDSKAAQLMVDGLKGVKGGKKKGDNEEDEWECRVADSRYIVQSLILGRFCEMDGDE